MTANDDLSRATALLAAGDLEGAGRLSEGSSDPNLRRISAYVLQQQGRLGEARQAYEAVLRAFPGDWESCNNLGNVLLALDQFDDAVAAFQAAIRLAAGPGRDRAQSVRRARPRRAPSANARR